ncbi:MAG TPA: (d)CMP kinase [Blastocatellia bacterium]|nr:(d)CMP kinase [Blastocatellia bacterium]
MQKFVIAIDGPSGSGKSTLGKALARRFEYLYIDSGAVYRAVGKKALDDGVDLSNRSSVAEIAKVADIRFEGDPDHLRVFLDGSEVTDEIRTPAVSNASSIVATIPEVREAVVDKLRKMARDGGVVMDGRDIGTRVFPDAQIKLFLDASVDVRAVRRCEEERARGRIASFEDVREEIESRDRRDRERSATPLVKAEGAIAIDSSDLSIEGVVQRVLEIMKSRG